MTPTELRKQLLRNGYVPLPNVGKACFMEKWPQLDVTEEAIERWGRRHSRYPDTGIRVENGLAVIDLDVDHPVLDRIAEAVEQRFPQLRGSLIRYGKGRKEAWFVRTAEPFTRLHSFRFWAPGLNDPDRDPAHCVEIFGGASARQFGAFGAHTRDRDGNVLVEYEWAEGDLARPEPEWATERPPGWKNASDIAELSPATVPLAALPELSKADFVEIVKLAEQIMRDEGFEQVKKSTSGESEAVRVFDLTDELVFECNDEIERTLAELREIAGEPGLRCSASWLEPGRGHSLTRCIVGRSRSGELTLWDSASGVTHMPADASPRDVERRQIDADVMAEKFKRLAELEEERKAKRRARLSSEDDHTVAAAKLLQTWAWCPTQQLGVVPLWATSTLEGMTLTNFRTTMLPWCGVEIGPRGGEKKINPVDLWSASTQRVTVEGLRLRPDKPRPTYEERGKTYINVYTPEVHPDGGGTPEGGQQLLEQLLPDPAERRWFTQWLAYKWQHPWVPGPAVLMVARDFGAGRGTLGELVKLMFGQRYVASIGFEHFAGRTYQSQYTAWQADSLVVLVNESSTADSGSQYRTKHDTYERLKEIVDPRARESTIVTHGKPAYKAMVFASYIIATNNPDALPLPPGDRRFWVGSNDNPPQPPEFWDGINRWMRDPENLGAWCRWLEAVDLSDYDPYAMPPMTRAKDAMSDLSRSDLDRAMADALERLPSEVLTPAHIIAAMQEAQRENGYDFPIERVEPIIKKMVSRQLHRVGEKQGQNWFMKVGSTRYPLYARTAATARKWTRENPEKVRGEVSRSGVPESGVSVPDLGRKLALVVNNGEK